MGEKFIGMFRQPIAVALLLIAVIAVLGGVGWAVYRTQAPPPQPVEFKHNIHVRLGVQCLYCHPGAWRGPSAGLPTQAKCWGCHQQIAKQSPELDKLAAYVQNEEPIPWVPVAIMPDFVYFSHRPHIAAGVNCEECHGDMSKVTIARNPKVMNMGWCMDCHKERFKDDAERLTRLLDCQTCHK